MLACEFFETVFGKFMRVGFYPLVHLVTKSLRYRTFSSSKMTTTIGVLQLCVNEEKSINFECARKHILNAVQHGAKMVFLPECFDFISSTRDSTLKNSEALDGPLLSNYKLLACDNKIWISLGGAHRKTNEADDDRIYNTHIVIDSAGQIAATYDKVHLFDVNIGTSGDKENGPSSARMSMCESRTIRPGNKPPPVINGTPIGSLGLAICYDMRFPELAAHLRYVGGAQVIAYPSAFSVPTGEAGHWHTLLRARAIENQCYVIAAAQEGMHNPKRSSYGHSLVIDPWGQIVAEQLEPGPGLFLCDIHVDAVPEVTKSKSPLSVVRQSIPVEYHRRFDLFPMQDSGQRRVYSLDYLADVLVCPLARLPRFDDLSPGQVADLYLTVKNIAATLAAHFSTTGLTISIQDGPDAGQSVPHVHVHVLPRKPNDFARNDDIYEAVIRFLLSIIIYTILIPCCGQTGI
ncbi:Nitrilase and fragile histidine triad fusion protein NitFhit [Paragonimus heterotremus]|uniref:Nitrilase and fragile histidine triad fusion protein NitFhit n=1 Tax=Paragonimus heterotremus TaxID=100268 RepID=A0A8J4WQ81_9TREM|nr:Nitrilase and fragile histidine triad fusion protein NitFhit [Paragonimus heterotremus]